MFFPNKFSCLVNETVFSFLNVRAGSFLAKKQSRIKGTLRIASQ